MKDRGRKFLRYLDDLDLEDAIIREQAIDLRRIHDQARRRRLERERAGIRQDVRDRVQQILESTATSRSS